MGWLWFYWYRQWMIIWQWEKWQPKFVDRKRRYMSNMRVTISLQRNSVWWHNTCNESWSRHNSGCYWYLSTRKYREQLHNFTTEHTNCSSSNGIKFGQIDKQMLVENEFQIITALDRWQQIHKVPILYCRLSALE